MPVWPTINPGLDAIRSIGGVLGSRPWVVQIVVRTYAVPGGIPGNGPYTDAAPVKLVNQNSNGAQNVRVKRLTSREIVASGGLFRDRDMRVGRFTPAFAANAFGGAGGYTDPQVDPATASAAGLPVAREIFWNISGPDMPTTGTSAGGIVGGAWCEKVYQEVTQAHYSIILRATGKRP